jgi:thymidylate kinase
MMTEAARTSETLVNFYQTTRRYNPEDSHLRTHRREKTQILLCRYYYSKIARQEWRQNLKNTFLLMIIIKQHMKIKIITYLRKIMKAAKR